MANVLTAATWQRGFLLPAPLRAPAVSGSARFIGALLVALLGFALVLLLQGRDPIAAYVSLFSTTLGTA